jgi:hypothetical protein
MDVLGEWFPWLVGGSTALIVVLSVISAICATAVPVAILGGVFYWLSKRRGSAKTANQASLSWPSTTGKVLKSRVEVSGGDHTSVSPRVVYEYEVSGKTYQNDHIRAGDRFLGRGWSSRDAYSAVDRYPEGASVTVYYNPANPAESALER